MTGRAIIIGAGPAGLTAAYELSAHTGVKPVVFEATDQVGGISRTVNYKGNRLDMGGHRFFSKSRRVMQWWLNLLPLQGAAAGDEILSDGRTFLPYSANGPDPESTDRVMLVRRRVSRILFMGQFYSYPIAINLTTLKQLGALRMMKIMVSYARSILSPIKPEKSLEEFFINRFGRELYLTFFKEYTEKVWGVPCKLLPPDWGSQRVKSLSAAKALINALRAMIGTDDDSLTQGYKETSLIDKFLYPKLGPGQLWEECAWRITERGGKIHFRHRVTGLYLEDGRITGVEVLDERTGHVRVEKADFVFSSMPVRSLARSFGDAAPPNVIAVAEQLVYRDFLTVGLLLKRLKLSDDSRMPGARNLIRDQWIYVQEPGVRLARIQVFNNWSPYLVKDPNTVWLGLEYMCNEHDELWNSSDDSLRSLAERELASINVADPRDVLDYLVVRVPKAYPAYLGGYNRFEAIRSFTDRIENLFLIGRNGMHRYNNQDHSMLSAMAAVENVTTGVRTKDNIWSINAEEEYHEEA